MPQPQPEKQPLETERERLLRNIQGKYAHVHTSSEAFAKRKMREIQLEEGWEKLPE